MKSSISILYFLSNITSFLCNESNVAPRGERDLESFNAIQNNSACTDLTFTPDLPSPNSPRNISASTFDRGMIELYWEHPLNTEWLTEFVIQCELVSTRLTKALQPADYHNSIHFRFVYNQKSYRAQLNLLPSTYYRIHIRAVVECPRYTLTSNASSIEIKTPSLFSWVEYEPSYTVNDTIHSITIKLPHIANATLNTTVHIIIIGPRLCTKTPIVNKILAKDIGLEDYERAWHVGTFSIPPPLISIGNGNVGDTTNCKLVECDTYNIVIVICDGGIGDLKLSRPLVWRSESIFINPTPTEFYKVWALVVLIMFVIGVVGCLRRPMRRNQHGNEENDEAVFEPVVELGRERPTSMNYRRSFLLVPPVPRHGSCLTPINEETDAEIDVKRKKFRDCVNLRRSNLT